MKPRCLIWRTPLIMLGIFLCAAAWAQDRQCEQSVYVDDVSCTGPHDCVSTTGCASTTFTAACTGYYNAIAAVVCSGGGDCSDFNACVNVYDSQGNRIGSNCHIPDGEDCYHQCSNAVCLVEGRQYTLYVCLTSCLISESCPQPTPNCYARGKVYFNGQGAPCN